MVAIIAPEMLGETIRDITEDLLHHGAKIVPQAALYCEKVGGFSCRTCRYAVPQNATHGRCAILTERINLDEGCCVAWDANPAILHLYREPESERHAV